MATDSLSQGRITRIGEVEILKTRVYSLDAECHCENASTILVEPGKYPLYTDGMTTWWVMFGQLNQRGGWRLGDGMFAVHNSDVPSGVEVTFPSRRFGSDEWADLIASVTFTDGNAEQRIRLLLAGSES